MKEEPIHNIKSIDLQAWLKIFSHHTWKRLGFSQKFRNEVKTYETTITQNLIYELLEIAHVTGNPSLRLLEARDESTNGNDIEIFVQYEDGYVLFPAQAKSVYPSGKYEKISHQSGGKFQIHALIEYAIKKQGVPVYLFYNYHKEWKDVIGWDDRLGFEHECFGCSLVNAHFMKKQYFDSADSRWKVPAFFDLHPKPAIPLFQILERRKMDHLWEGSKAFILELALYRADEVFNEKKWADRTPPPRISGFPKEEHFYQGVVQMGQPEFRPKFRIVLAQHEKGGMRISEIY